MKKITLLATILIIFNFIYSTTLGMNVYATSDNNKNEVSNKTSNSSTNSTTNNETSTEESGDSGQMTMGEYKELDEGRVKIGSTEKTISIGDSDTGSAASKIASTLSSFAATFVKMVSDITNKAGYYYTDSEYSASKTGLFTINSLVFGEYLLFNSKAYQKSTDLNPDIVPTDVIRTIDDIKENGAEVSNVVSRVGIAISLPLVIYAIIRTLMARKASDLAAWKKILVRWIICLALIFFFEYILAAIDAGADIFTNGFWKIRQGLETDDYRSFEYTVETDIMDSIEKTGGMTSLAYSIEFVALVILQMLFLVKFIIRTFAIIGLFIMAPIIIVVHSVNLMMGRQSNILGEFFKAYIIFTFMQPFYALFYLIFFFALSEIAIKVPILGILFIYALYRAGNIAKSMFGWRLGSSITSGKE